MPSVLFNHRDLKRLEPSPKSITKSTTFCLWYSWIHQEALCYSTKQSLAQPLLTYGSQIHPNHPSSLWSHHISRMQRYTDHLHSGNAHFHILQLHKQKKTSWKTYLHRYLTKEIQMFYKNEKLCNELVIKGMWIIYKIRKTLL